MEAVSAKKKGGNGTTIQSLPLHTRVLMPHAWANRVFAFVYLCAILALLYHHLIHLLHSTSMVSIFLLLADAVLAFMWVASQACRMCPTERRVFIEHLQHYAEEREYPGLDVFICTADPYKEPPMSVVNTALSVMAYEYPIEKLSVYVSDDGGSKLTLFAFMEAAKFATHWLPYCRKNKLMERCPEAYFRSNPPWLPETDQIKMKYESMRIRVKNTVERGSICPDYITSEEESEAFSRWTDEFTPQDHPPVVKVLLEHGKDEDVTGHTMPNLVYVSRGKSINLPRHFKAGALNALLRVSASMTNAPVVLTLDSDMYSNDPKTPLRALCFLLDPCMDSKLGFIQFPQVFDGINKNDIYGSESIQTFQINTTGMDGLAGPLHVGTGCFFRRQVFFGGLYEAPRLNPDHLVSTSIKSKEVLAMAHHVAGCNYENQTKWGSKMGFRYGSLVEDVYTGYLLHCEGWKSIFCNPKRPAFTGKAPINLSDMLNQVVRWSVGLYEVAFCKYSPITFGVHSMNLLMGLCYSYYVLVPLFSIPLTIYAFLPQLAVLNSISIFPKVSDPWFFLYVFLFLGAYIQDYLNFILFGGTTQKWWNNQRAWMIRGLTGFTFGSVEYMIKSLGISAYGFNVTSKVVNEKQSKRYNQGKFEFGVPSPLFLPLTTAAILNLVSFLLGIIQVLKYQRSLEGLFVQMFLTGFAVVNFWPLYEAMLRTDEGKMPTKITLISIVLAWALYLASSMALF